MTVNQVVEMKPLALAGQAPGPQKASVSFRVGLANIIIKMLEESDDPRAPAALIKYREQLAILTVAGISGKLSDISLTEYHKQLAILTGEE